MRKIKYCSECGKKDNYDVTCDICGSDCKVEISNDGDTNVVDGRLELIGCYGSKYDLEKVSVDLCEKCFDRVLEFIESIGGKVNREEQAWN